MQYVDLPPREAVYEILRTCLAELVAKGIISDVVSTTQSFRCGSHMLIMVARCFQEVPSLTQAQLYERTAFTAVPTGSTSVVEDSNTAPNAQTTPTLRTNGVTAVHAASTGHDSRERGKSVALRLLALAQKCRVSRLL